MKVAPIRILVIAALILSLPACSLFSKDKSSDYREGGGKAKPLEVPPDLTAPSLDDRYTVPDSKSSTSFSAYNRDRAAPAAPKATGVLPKMENNQNHPHVWVGFDQGKKNQVNNEVLHRI